MQEIEIGAPLLQRDDEVLLQQEQHVARVHAHARFLAVTNKRKCAGGVAVDPVAETGRDARVRGGHRPEIDLQPVPQLGVRAFDMNALAQDEKRK